MKKSVNRYKLFFGLISAFAFGFFLSCGDNTTNPESTPPTAPTNLQAAAAGDSVINLSWSASTDNVAVTGYNVYRGSVLIGRTKTTSFRDTGLSPGSSYVYTVAANDCFQSSAPSAPAVGTTTGAAVAPNLRSAVSFAVLAGTAINSAGLNIITGDVGVSPGNSINGTPPVVNNGTVHLGDSTAAQAQLHLLAAYNDLAGRYCPPGNDYTGQTLGQGGLTSLTPGVYCFNGPAPLTGALTLNGQGNANALFVFQIAANLVTSAGSSVVLTNGTTDANVFWLVGGSANLGAASSFRGTVIAGVDCALGNGATMSNGRATARSGAVTLDANTITRP